ncbi:hypothetical protein [Rhodospirillaceae bacterium SYSU D60014]|uniref:hypothetical protein n=1 Tax=Virgifigura deserti TaxID=2268457 RepID=UPI000E676107
MPTTVTAAERNGPSAWPITLLVGLGLILVCEILLAVDVVLRDGAVVPYDALLPAVGPLQTVTRWVAQNMTPLCWVGYLFAFDGLLQRQGRGSGEISPVRARPRRFILCFLASIPIWLVFDAINFGLLDAWRYHGLPRSDLHRLISYFFSFGAIVPAMLLAAEFFQRAGLRRLEGPVLWLSPRAQTVLALIGLGLVLLPLLIRNPIGTVPLWLGFIFLLDPINHRFGAPSLLADWAACRWSRTVALMAGGLLCGFLWEFWNYWATAKWTYDLPFLGPLESIRYFEMPVPGLLGFPPFALECWIMFQSVLLLLDRLGLRFAEPLPNDAAIL